MDAFRVGEVEIERQILRQLLLELNVSGIDSGVCIILAKHTDRCERRQTAQRRNVHDVGPHWQALTVAATKGRSAGDAKLLYAIVRDRTHLRQHVLAAVEDTCVSPKH